MRTLRTFFLLALLIATTGCDRTTRQALPPARSPTTPATQSVPEPKPEPVTTPPPEPKDDAPAQAENQLGFDLYGRLRKQPGNLALSPASISTALAMTWAGARGETAQQMQKVLHFAGPQDEAVRGSGQLARSLESPGRAVTLRSANRLFGAKSYEFEKPYLDLTRDAFGAPLEPVDFAHAAAAARMHVNRWVEDHTQKRIRNLIPPEGVSAETRLILVNAIYFLGDWRDPFKKESTARAPFHVSNAEQHDVPTMHQTERFRYVAKDGLKAVELPYKGDDMSMLIVLPDAVDGLDALEASFDAKKLDGIVDSLGAQRVAVALPKFEVNPGASLGLRDILKELGMSLAFDPSEADFTGMAKPTSRSDRVCISDVFHKAFVKVDEKGTEAAAASAVGISMGSIALESTVPFTADHPFLFFIRDHQTGLVLFMGRVQDPARK